LILMILGRLYHQLGNSSEYYYILHKMKKSTVLFAFLMLSLASFAQNSGLWLLTAKITESYTLQQDTLISFMAGNKK